LICSVFSPPGIENTYEAHMLNGIYYYTLDSINSIFVLFKSYLVIRFYSHYSKWFTYEAEMLIKRFGFTPNIGFVIKAELKRRPFKILLVLILVVSIEAALMV
jgi:hypothetical protein